MSRLRPVAALLSCLLGLLCLLEISRAAPTGRVTPAKPKPGRMITVPAGWFYMGTTVQQARRALVRFSTLEARKSTLKQLGSLLAEELPRRRIWVSTFRLDRLEVTRADYRRCVTRGRCKAVARPSRLGSFRKPTAPMVNVTWHEAAAYCRFRGKRLPTEAEWEKAARGPLGRLWPWGNRWHERACNHGTIHPIQDLYHGSATDGWFWIAPVGSLATDRSYYGVMDLGGNAAEWTADWYRFRWWSTGRVKRRDPKGPPGGHGRLVKGGSWRRLRLQSRAAAKRWLGSKKREPDVGFRCAK